VEIRFAKQEDIPQLLNLLEQIGRLHYQGRPDIFRQDAQKYDAQALQALLADANRPILVAAESDKVLGYAFCIRKEVSNDPVLADEVSLYLDDLCVDSEARGQGIGGKLYEACKNLGIQMGATRLTLNVWGFNASALRFYEKCGMEKQRIYMETPLEGPKC